MNKRATLLAALLLSVLSFVLPSCTEEAGEPAVNPYALVGVWEFDHYLRSDGGETSPHAGSRIEFKRDGSIEGITESRQCMGGFKASDLGDIKIWYQPCAEVELSEAEAAFADNLKCARLYFVEGEKLTISCSTGEKMKFHRADMVVFLDK